MTADAAIAMTADHVDRAPEARVPAVPAAAAMTAAAPADHDPEAPVGIARAALGEIARAAIAPEDHALADLVDDGTTAAMIAGTMTAHHAKRRARRQRG